MYNHVLIAEPSSTRAAVIQHALYRLADTCHVHTVVEGPDVVDYLFALGPYSDSDMHSQPHLLILNLELPNDQAIDVLRILQKIRKTQQQTLPVVVGLSERVPSQTCEKAIALGIQGLVPIPSSDRELVARIRQAAEYWLELDQTIVVNRKPNYIARPIT